MTAIKVFVNIDSCLFEPFANMGNNKNCGRVEAVKMV